MVFSLTACSITTGGDEGSDYYVVESYITETVSKEDTDADADASSKKDTSSKKQQQTQQTQSTINIKNITCGNIIVKLPEN